MPGRVYKGKIRAIGYGDRNIDGYLSSIFGLLALGLACMGLYGLLSYEMTRRTQEIGIRIALCAQNAGVLRLIMERGIVLSIAGAAAGVAAAVGITQFMASMLF